ncbi:hypothetical protein [Pseudonocardia sp. TRM90224]|uniref:hypothetical protein n=1 Tax=Pseudonocardia sp. TRM90224 TaxID=2812678 RepID=UPI001E4E1879|nr:hypothetical protein [Pseudonocardia sp. TRM90224]
MQNIVVRVLATAAVAAGLVVAGGTVANAAPAPSASAQLALPSGYDKGHDGDYDRDHDKGYDKGHERGYDKHYDRYGPYEQESSCLRAGNDGVEWGYWYDYKCYRNDGEWYLYPTYWEADRY